jgi:hypothetical protein
MTPQAAYEKRYAHLDHGQHTWDAAPPHVQEMWLAAWAMAESVEREACAQICEDYWSEGHCDMAVAEIAAEIRARGQE